MEDPFFFNYPLTTQPLNIGGVELRICRLQDLDEAIDQLFEALEKTGRPELLERLSPYFGVIWPSAVALAETVAAELQVPSRRRPPSILELGCGLAVPSLLAARLGAAPTVTDFHPEVPRFLERNIELNNAAALRYVEADWSAISAASALPAGLSSEGYELVIASDVLYERHHATKLLGTIARLLAPQGEAIVTDPARPYLQSFVDEAARAGFETATSVREITLGDRSQEIFQIRLRRK